jgi:hypothetical protein
VAASLVAQDARPRGSVAVNLVNWTARAFAADVGDLFFAWPRHHAAPRQAAHAARVDEMIVRGKELPQVFLHSPTLNSH